jgi:hypothetical protein
VSNRNSCNLWRDINSCLLDKVDTIIESVNVEVEMSF